MAARYFIVVSVKKKGAENPAPDVCGLDYRI
jgi:hypothetical protein